MPNCARCDRENRRGALFCRHCGEPMGRSCPACGEANLPDAAFCDRCGAPLAEDAPRRLSSDRGVRAGAGEAPPAGAGGYTPPHLRSLFSERGGVRGERKEVIVLFADVSGYTSLSERIDAEELHEVMNGCFDILTNEVHRFGGTVNQYTGDGIMALFGAPRAVESAPRDSIRAALAIQQRMRDYAARLEAERGIGFRVRMGLNAGEVVVGAIGDDLRMDYTAMGDTTNVAARLQSAADPGEILVSEGLFLLTRDWFRFEDLGERDFKGKSKTLRVYRVLGRGKVSTRIEAAALRGLVRLREREDALESLLRIYAEVAQGHGQIVALAGEAGIGKSRMVYELKEALKRAETEAPLFIFASATHYDRYAPLSLLRRILKAYARVVGLYCPVEGAEEDALWREIVSARASQLLPEEDAAAAIERLLMRAGGGREGRAAGDPRSGFESIRRLFIRESQERPFVLAVDNMRDVEPSSMEFLEMLAGGLAAARILFVPVHRLGFENPWVSRSNFHQITLRPLSRAAGEEMIGEILGGKISAGLLEAMHSRAQGNPFFIEEMVRGMRDSGALLQEGGEWRLKAPEEEIVLPRTVQDVILARLDALPARLREVLQTASVVGPRFDYDLLYRVCGGLPDLEERLADLQDMELIYAADGSLRGEWRFVNRLVQEMAYKEMLRAQQAEIHERVGLAIEAQGPAAIEQNLDRLASHFQRSDALERAAHYLIRAGRRAYALLALPLAASRLEQGLIFMESLGEESEKHLAERIRVRGDLALALLALGAGERRIESLVEEMREMAERAGDWGQVAMAHIHMCTLRFRQGNHAAVVRSALRAIQMAHRVAAFEPLFRAYSALASAHRFMGRSRESIEESHKAIAIYRNHIREDGLGNPELQNVIVETLAILSSTHAHRGEVEEAERWLARARRAVEEFRAPVAGGLVRYFENSLFMIRRQWAASASSMAALLEELEKVKFPFARAGVALNLGLARIFLGEPEAGLALVDRAIEGRSRIGQKLLLGVSYLARAEGLRLLGRMEEALGACRTAQESATLSGEAVIAAFAEELEARIRCEVAAGAGLGERVAAYEGALARLEALEQLPALARGRRALAGFLGRLGEEGRARELEERAREYLRAIGASDAEWAPAEPAAGIRGA